MFCFTFSGGETKDLRAVDKLGIRAIRTSVLESCKRAWYVGNRSLLSLPNIFATWLNSLINSLQIIYSFDIPNIVQRTISSLTEVKESNKKAIAFKAEIIWGLSFQNSFHLRNFWETRRLASAVLNYSHSLVMRLYPMCQTISIEVLIPSAS
jgi:hypothetical protein